MIIFFRIWSVEGIISQSYLQGLCLIGLGLGDHFQLFHFIFHRDSYLVHNYYYYFIVLVAFTYLFRLLHPFRMKQSFLLINFFLLIKKDLKKISKHAAQASQPRPTRPILKLGKLDLVFLSRGQLFDENPIPNLVQAGLGLWFLQSKANLSLHRFM